MMRKGIFWSRIWIFALCLGMGFFASSLVAFAGDLTTDDNSSYDLPQEPEDSSDEEEEDMTDKIVIAVRKPTAFRVYSKKEGVFIVVAKNKSEITGYDIRVRKADSDQVTNYRAITTHDLFRRFVGAKPDSKYKVKVRTFKTVNGKDYPSKWTKELQVIVWPRSDDGTPSGTTLHELGRDTKDNPAGEVAAPENKKKKKGNGKNK
ncbi:MAG: hypothetical protein IJ679_05115 [Lachnospiraceae bacterium]|nr:hypothetical protein [Lachnospiraceae bacterium]